MGDEAAWPSLHGRRALVTGATGFIGRQLVPALNAAGCAVTALVRNPERVESFQNVWGRVQVVGGDLSVPSSLDRLEPSCASDLVFHLAAAGTDQRERDLRRLTEVNVFGTLQVLELARRGGARRVLCTGSSAEYGGGSRLSEDATVQPTSLYGVSKAAASLLVQAFGRTHGVPGVFLRFFSLFGEGDAPQRLVPHTIRCALEGRDIPLTSGEQVRDFLYLGDAVEALVRAAVQPGIEGETFNVCSGQETRVRELVSQILRLLGEPVRPLFGALAYREDEARCVTGDPSKARARLGWTARTAVKEGLRRTIAWMRADARRPGTPLHAAGVP